MITVLILWFAVSAAVPDPKLTPGVAATTSARTICAKTFRTRDERHVTLATKRKICRLYHVEHCPKYGAMEIDHLISLELGGADDPRNLWVQFAPDYKRKDKLEGFLHRKVCKGELELKDAQRCIVKNWAACADRYGVE